MSRSTSKFGFAIAVLLLCLAVTGILWSVPVSTTNVKLNVRCKKVTFRTAEPWIWQGNAAIGSSVISARCLSSAEIRGIGLRATRPETDLWMDIKGEESWLTQLSVERAAMLTIEPGGRGGVGLYFNDAQTVIELLIGGYQQLEVGDESGHLFLDTTANLVVPEVIRATCNRSGTVPMCLNTNFREETVFRNVYVDSLLFSQVISTGVGSSEFISSIGHGRISLLDSQEEIELTEGDRLSIGGISGVLTKVGVGDELQVVFEGKVSDIVIGSYGYERNPKPSLLKYIYHNENVIFLWGSIAFIWSGLWGIRNTLFRRNRE